MQFNNKIFTFNQLIFPQQKTTQLKKFNTREQSTKYLKIILLIHSTIRPIQFRFLFEMIFYFL